MQNKYPKVELYFGFTREGKVSKITKGLLINDKIYTWDSIKKRYGITSTHFMKRKHSNPHWPLGKVLTDPFQRGPNAGKRPGDNVELIINHHKSFHDPWEIERNYIMRTMRKPSDD